MSYYCITIDGAFPGGQKEILTFLWPGKDKQHRKRNENERKEKQIM